MHSAKPSKRKTNMSKFHVAVYPQLVVVDVNPENADYTNPRGERHGEVYHIAVSNKYGRRWMSRDSFVNRELAEWCVTDIDRDINVKGNKLLPREYWPEIQPVYGSPCYVNECWEEDTIAWEKELDERD
jgi:hypothetical protein